MIDIVHSLGLDSFVSGDLLVIATLVVLEGLLSCDNAVVLAMQVRNLPPEQRGQALRYGILGAYFFRIVALTLANVIISQWWVKVLGGIYLLWMSVKELLKKKKDSAEEAEAPSLVHVSARSFWSTVLAVEMTDIIFSVDSIAAAVALSTKLYVLIVGAMLGILAMRFAAQGFIGLLERFPRLERAAFWAVAIIGLKLLLEFPVDFLGGSRPMPEPAQPYASIEQWKSVAEQQHGYLVHVSAAFSIRSEAIDPPQAAQFSLAEDHAHAMGYWTLHYRPLLHVEGWLMSLLVILVFVPAFSRGRQPKSPANDA